MRAYLVPFSANTKQPVWWFLGVLSARDNGGIDPRVYLPQIQKESGEESSNVVRKDISLNHCEIECIDQ